MYLENLQKFVLVLLYGGLVLQSFIVLVNPMNVNRKANLFFGLFLFCWSSYWLTDVVRFCGFLPAMPFVLSVQSFQIFTPVFLFFSCVAFINPNYRFKKVDLFCLVVPVFYWVLLWRSAEAPFTYKMAMLIDVAQNLPYIIFISFKIRRYQKRLTDLSSCIERINLKWFAHLNALLFITIVITVAYELYNTFVEKRHQHLGMDVLFLVIAYSAAYYSLRQKEIYPLDKKQRAEWLEIELEEQPPVDKKQLIADEDFAPLKLKLSNLMESQKPYLDGELNLLKLAEAVGLSGHQLSYLLNNGFGVNFFQFVNGYRVQEAKVLLSDPDKSHLSMLGIAFESGFNSKTAFNTAFKKLTGLSPSAFKQRRPDL